MLHDVNTPTQKEQEIFIFYHLVALTRTLIKKFVNKNNSYAYLQLFKDRRYVEATHKYYLYKKMKK